MTTRSDGRLRSLLISMTWEAWRRGLAWSRRVSDIPQLVAATDGRLAEIAAEIVALEATRAELAAPRAGGQARANTNDATATRAPRRAARRRLTPSRTAPGAAIRSRDREPSPSGALRRATMPRATSRLS